MTNGKKCLNMLNSKTDMEWIDGFLRQELSESEEVTFKGRLAKEAAFAVLFEEQQLLVNGIRLNQLVEKANHFQQLGQEIDGNLLDEVTIGQAVRYDKGLDVLERLKARGREMDKVVITKNFNQRKWWSIAASVLFLIGLSWYIFSYSSKDDYQLLAEKYNEPYPAIGITKSIEEDLQKDQIRGLQLYTIENYDKALPYLKKNFLTNEYNENSLYISICYLKKNQLDSAYKYLQQTPTLVPELADAARWHLAIYYLKKESIEEVFQELELLSQSEALSFRRKATELKKELLLLK